MVEESPAWAEQRVVLVGKICPNLLLPALVRAMLESEEAWAAIFFCEEE